MKDPWKKYQFVWPKDRRARDGGPDSWVDRLSDIAMGKGPDMFVAKAGEPIKADRWGNWDGYHSRNKHYDEQNITHPFWNKARGTRRYDPESRTYREWRLPTDFYNDGVDGCGIEPFGKGYTHFTVDEWKRIAPAIRRGRKVDTSMMGNEWTQVGPKRFDEKHDHFWQHAHRIGENRELYDSLGFNVYDPYIDQVVLLRDKNINPFLTMRNRFSQFSLEDELRSWLMQEN